MTTGIVSNERHATWQMILIVYLFVLESNAILTTRDNIIAVSDAFVFPGFLTPVMTLFFPKPSTPFLTCISGKRQKITRKKVFHNQVLNSQINLQVKSQIWNLMSCLDGHWWFLSLHEEMVYFLIHLSTLQLHFLENNSLYIQGHLTIYYTIPTLTSWKHWRKSRKCW